MNRRDFISKLAGTAVFNILPGAGRIWKPTKRISMQDIFNLLHKIKVEREQAILRAFMLGEPVPDSILGSAPDFTKLGIVEMVTPFWHRTIRLPDEYQQHIDGVFADSGKLFRKMYDDSDGEGSSSGRREILPSKHDDRYRISRCGMRAPQSLG